MKQRIILLSGFGGAGKSTVGEQLQERLASCARIEADDLILIKPFLIGEAMGRIKTKNVITVTQNFIAENFEHILIIGYVWSQRELDEIAKHFQTTRYEVHMFWLHASKEVRYSRVKSRDKNTDSESWLDKVEGTVPYPLFPLKLDGGHFYKLDVDATTSEEVTKEILKCILG